MAELLHALHEHRPLPRGPYPTAVWPAGCTHLEPAAATAPAGMVRAAWLIDANTKRYTDQTGTRWHMVAAEHERTIRELADRVNVAEGNNLKAARGCSLAYLVFGPLEVAVEYEFEPASGDGWNEPRYEASVSVLRVYLNGHWCDATDVASADQISKWEVSILEGGEV